MKTDKEVEAFVQRMGKRLSESPRASRSGTHRATFIALRPFIEGALARGYTMKATWAGLREENRLTMSYQTFRTHCRRAGIGQLAEDVAPSASPRPEPPPSASEPASPRGPSAVNAAGDGPHRGFRHQRVPRKDEIYG